MTSEVASGKRQMASGGLDKWAIGQRRRRRREEHAYLGVRESGGKSKGEKSRGNFYRSPFHMSHMSIRVHVFLHAHDVQQLLPGNGWKMAQIEILGECWRSGSYARTWWWMVDMIDGEWWMVARDRLWSFVASGMWKVKSVE